MPKKSRRSRDRKIVKGILEGKSLRKIGKEVGISHVRVYQLLPRLEPAIQEALKRVDYDLTTALTKVVEMTDAEKTEEHYAIHEGIISDERVVRKADNATRLKARELMMRLNVGHFDNRAEVARGTGTTHPSITINLGVLGREEAAQILAAARARINESSAGQPVLDAERDKNKG